MGNGDGYDSTCLRIDRCCEMTFSTWYWRPGQGVCSNAPVFGAPDEFTYDNYSDCCEDRFGSSGPIGVPVSTHAILCLPRPLCRLRLQPHASNASGMPVAISVPIVICWIRHQMI